jgi:hypothetical protein
MDDRGAFADAAIEQVDPVGVAVGVPSAGGLRAYFGNRDEVAEEIDVVLPESKGQLGLVASCIEQGRTELKDIVEAGAAANTGAAANLIVNIRAIRNGEIPTDAPSRARLALGAARSFLKQHGDRLSQAARNHVNQVVEQLLDVAADPTAQAREEAELQGKGDILEDTLVAQGGVYVYTFPHYFRFPTVEGTNRTLLKVGMTSKDASERVRQQARLTGVPEDPLLLRVYQHPTRDPRDIEKDFHLLLNAADHSRGDTKTGGKEWFETSIDFLDAIAEVLELTVTSAES